MSLLRTTETIILTACATLTAGFAGAQSYPVRPVRIVAAEPGGASDLVARLIGQGLPAGLGQQAIVDNRGGAGGVIAGDAVAKATPDGYTILLHGSAIWLAPLLRNRVPFDPVKDLAPISLAVSAPNVIVVHPSVGVKTVKELIAIAKKRPGDLNYGTGSVGSGAHLAAELFNSLAGVKLVRVPYKGTGAAVNDLVGGQIQIMFSVASSVMPHVKTGRLVALAITSAQPSPLFPNLPTVASAGLHGYEAASIYGYLAPSATPAAIITRLNQEIVKVINRTDVKEKFLAAGMETIGSTPEQFAAAIQGEITRLGKVIKDAGIHDDG